MMKYLNWTSVIIGTIGGYLAKLLGGYDMLLQTILLMVVLDYATGIIKALYQKQLSSAIGFKGIIKKVMVFIVIAAANSLQHLLGDIIPIREIVIMFFIANEGLSLLENAAVMIAIPEPMKEVLLQIREGKKEEE